MALALIIAKIVYIIKFKKNENSKIFNPSNTYI